MSAYKRDVSISLNLYDEAPPKRQSLLRSWRRLSSLQRMIIGLLLLCTVIIAFFVLPGVLSRTEQEQDVIIMEISSTPADTKHPADNVKDKNEETDKPNDSDGIHENFVKPLVNPKVEQTYDFFHGQSQTDEQKQIVAAFKHAWTAYKKYAWGHDELLPISKTYSEWFGTGLTLVDSLDTMVIMGLKEEYEEAKQWVSQSLTFNVDRFVNLFEVTIRILGSLLATYHLTGDEVMKSKAIDLGDRLLPAFKSGSQIPFSDVNLAKGEAKAPRWGPDSSTSEVTTIQLEFRDLTKLTGDPKYQVAVNDVSIHVHELPKTNGLVPIFINANSGDFRPSSTITLGARGDSYYEYLLKQWIQSGKKLTIFKDDFVESVEGVKKWLVRKSEPSKLTFIGELLNGKNFSPKMDHLTCFYPGTLALAAYHGLSQEYLELGKELLNTCWETYRRMPTRLSPEITYFNLAEGASEDLIVKPLDAHNLLRPETLESMFYLYRITGDKRYRDQAWQIFLAFEKHTKLADGYSSIHNVKDSRNPRFRDKMESFFLAETLKYLYLIFSDDKQLIPIDMYVFNSEGHPLPIDHSDK